MAYARTAATTLYDYLLDSDVEVYEFMERPLHAKVAVFDTEWSTVGSSNMDPLSFALNFEANLFIHSSGFAEQLRDSLMKLLSSSHRMTRDDVPRQRGWRHVIRIVVFHFLRRFPRWFGKFPNYRQQVEAGADAIASGKPN
jgi:cardiolipin synthase